MGYAHDRLHAPTADILTDLWLQAKMAMKLTELEMTGTGNMAMKMRRPEIDVCT